MGVGPGKLHLTERVGYKEKQITVFHNVSGQIVEATGLKGNLGMCSDTIRTLEHICLLQTTWNFMSRSG